MLRTLYTILLLIPLLAGCTLFPDHETGVAEGGLRIKDGGMLSSDEFDEPCIGMTTNASGLNVLYFSSNREGDTSDTSGETYHIYRAVQTAKNSDVYLTPTKLSNSEGIREFAAVTVGGVDYIAGMKNNGNERFTPTLLRVIGNDGRTQAITMSVDNLDLSRIIALLPPGARLGNIPSAGGQIDLIYANSKGEVQYAYATVPQREEIGFVGSTNILIRGGNFAGGGSYVPPKVIGGSNETNGWLLYSRLENEESSNYSIYINNFNGTEKRLDAFNSEGGSDRSPIYVQSENKVYMTSTRDGNENANIYRWNRTTLRQAYNNESSAGSASSAPKRTGVYIAGVVQNGSYQYIPGYWVVDGADASGSSSAQPRWVALSAAISFAQANAVYVADNVVYVAGAYDGKAVWWSHNLNAGSASAQQHILNSANDGEAYSIYVSGNSVYIAGRLNDYGKTEGGCVWIASASGTLTATIDMTAVTYSVNDVKADTNGMHITGEKTEAGTGNKPFYKKFTPIPSSDSTINTGSLNETVLGSTIGSANALALGNNGTIHIVGYSHSETASMPFATHWIINNGTLAADPFLSDQYSEARAIWLDGNSVFIAGDDDTATLWNGEQTVFSYTGSEIRPKFYGICVGGSNVYVTGQALPLSMYTQKAGYWKNNNPGNINDNNFTHLSTADSCASGAFYYGG